MSNYSEALDLARSVIRLADQETEAGKPNPTCGVTCYKLAVALLHSEWRWQHNQGKEVEGFSLVIELGNDGMQTPADVAAALRKTAGQVGVWAEWPNTDEVYTGVRDGNGNTVGEWEIRS